MKTKMKSQYMKADWLRLTALAGLSSLAVFAFYQDAKAGPISGGPGNPPFVKLGVYQGVLSIVPGAVGDSVMEIGNAGRDIGSTGSIYIRPNAATVTDSNLYARFYGGGAGNAQTALSLPGPLCLNGACITTWGDVGGSVSGTANRLPKYDAAGTAFADSALYENPSTGNVSVGSTNTLMKLNVLATSGDASLRINNHNSVAVGSYLGRYNLSNDFNPGNNYYTYLANGGYHVSGDANSDLFVVENQYVDAQVITMNANKGTRFLYGDAASNGATVTLAELMRLTNSGNLGIQTNAPSANLQVAQRTTGVGTVSISGTSITGTGTQFLNTFKVGDNITVTTTAGSETRAIATIGSDTFMLAPAFTGTASGATYSLSGGTRFSVLGNGNVGIGTTAPAEKLEVTGNIRINANNIYGRQDVVGTVIRTTRTDNTQQGLFRTNGWGDFTYDRSVGIGYNLSGASSGVGNLFVAGRVGVGTAIPSATPSAKLVINNGLSGSGSAGDGVSVYANTGNSAIYSEQQNVSATAWAGYFSGGVNVTGRLCLGGVCITQWTDVGGGPGATPTLDQVLAAGNTASNKTALFASQANDGRSIIATSGAAVPVQTSTDSFVFVVPKLSASPYNWTGVVNDSGIYFSEDTGLNVGGWNPILTSNRLKGARFTGANVNGAALAINNQEPGWFSSGNGSAGDGLAVRVDSPNSAVYAEQGNSAGWAGYFSGRVNVGSFYIAGRLKPQASEVCQVGTDTCLGRYTHTVNVGNPVTEQICYARSNCPGVTGNPIGPPTFDGNCFNPLDDASPFACVNVYAANSASYCHRGDSLQLAGPTTWSYYTLAGCAASDEHMLYGSPYRNIGGGTYICAEEPQPFTMKTFNYVKGTISGIPNNCVQITSANAATYCAGTFPCTKDFWRVMYDRITATGYSHVNEIR